jgi:hypothetical protein
MRKLLLLFALLRAFSGLYAVGLATALADGWLGTLRGGGNGTNYTAPASTHAQLHTADPGAAGNTAASAETDRMAVEFGAPGAGGGGRQMSLSNAPSWATWDQGPETISHISVWDAATDGTGNFLYSAALTTPRAVDNDDTLNLTSLTFALTPIAA